MMNKSHRIAAILAFGVIEAFLVMGLFVRTAHAETRVGGVITGSAVWEKDAGPYLLTDHLTLTDGASLAIEPGTSVGIAPEADTGDVSYAPAIFVAGGTLSIRGALGSRVQMKGLGGIFVSSGQWQNGVADLAYADLVGGSGISFENSMGTIATSSIEGAYTGLYFKDSIVVVAGSRLKGNDIGIYVQPHRVILSEAFEFGIGGIGNAVDEAPDLHASSSLTIRGSSLTGNASHSVFNNSEMAVQAQDNWWGSADGPTMTGENSLRGDVGYSPWLQNEPQFNVTAEPRLCCSSILFIPGLEASRLYRRPNLPDQLWEPLFNSDVVKLRLSTSGSSTDPTIYSGKPIDKALGALDVYGRFMKSLDRLVTAGTVTEWIGFGYDWRKPIDEVVLGMEKKATTTESLMGTVADLASRSKTGKISIVAHSNGGLVAKYLVKALAEAGKADLIDAVVSVAVPYLGTPQAIGGLLHGDDQAILGGLILNKGTARSLGINMPSAYSLLPSRRFFTEAFGPTIAFASTTIPGINNGSYPLEADSFEEQQAFLVDAAGARKAPPERDTKMPVKANRKLLLAADVLHSILDPFQWPATIARWAIIGWNATTTAGIAYSDKGHAPARSAYGDGTVVAPSAAYQSGQAVPIDLAAASRLERSDFSHANILGASSTQAALHLILTNPPEHAAETRQQLARIPAVSVGNKDWRGLEASSDPLRREIRISTHSPVKLHVYDAHGNHTGEAALPPSIASQAEEGLYSMKEENIPGSIYEVLGCESEDDCDTQVVLPDDGGDYFAVVDGVGTGTFTLNIERIRGASTTEAAEWKDIPVTRLATATSTIQGSRIQPQLAIDIDGDGTVDATSTQGTAFGQIRSRDLLRKFKWPKAIRRRFKSVTHADRARILVEIAAFMRRFER